MASSAPSGGPSSRQQQQQPTLSAQEINRRDFQTRERQNVALSVLSSHEMLMKHATINHESIPQTRLRFEKMLAGIEETRRARYVDVPTKEDPKRGTWAEREHTWRK